MEQQFPRQEVRRRLFEEYRRQGFWGTRTFRDILEVGCLRHWPENRFIIDSPFRPADVSFRELYQRGQHLAGALRALGLRKGDVLAVQLPNWLEGVLAYHAATALGLIVVPIVHIYRAKEVEFILRQSRAKVFIVASAWRNIDYKLMLADIRSRLPNLEHVIIVGDNVPTGCVAFAELEERGTEDFPRPALSPDEPHILVYTSGTTAEPKGVVHSHNTLLWDSYANRAVSGPGEDEVTLSVVPLGHIAGINGMLISPFYLGEKKVLMDGWDPRRAMELIQEYKVTAMGGPSYFPQTLLDHPDFGRYDLSSLRQIGLGGSPVPLALVRRVLAQGWFSYRSYGCTEHPSVTKGTRDDPPEKLACTDGRPMLGVEMRLVDEEGQDVPTGTDGEILTRGPDQMLGFMSPALDAEAFTADGWLRTGDIGRVDAEGYLTVTDRKKDIIVRGGENISTLEVEQVLQTHASVLEAAVVPAPDPVYGERVCAYVILRPGTTAPSIEDIKAHFASRGLAKQKTPERIEVVDDLPRTSTGKVQKFSLRKQLRNTASPG